MASYLLWLDASEHARRRMLDAIDLLKQKETVDELGLGSIRDTIADVLSPGTSTIQTRARYFFFIPWIYLALEASAGAPERISNRSRAREVALINALADSADPAGTIGIQARASLRRLSSMVYWAGLGRLGFRLFPGSQDQYHRNFGRLLRLQHEQTDSDSQTYSSARGNWHPHIPASPVDFPAKASFRLRPEEADFFREQIRIHAHGSLLHVLIDSGKVDGIVDFPWQLPSLTTFPTRLREWIEHARQFSTLMHGAQLTYNLMLAEALPSTEYAQIYRDLLEAWVAQVTEELSEHRAWNRKSFWQKLRSVNPALPVAAEAFCENWLSLLLGAQKVGDVPTDDRARNLIAAREQRLKGNRARLVSRAHLEVWGGASGAGALDYRWGATQNLVRDICCGLGDV